MSKCSMEGDENSAMKKKIILTPPAEHLVNVQRNLLCLSTYEQNTHRC